jgi:DNA-3-methyladenine glycosylase I
MMQVYHDREWGTPVHDDRVLFEMLVLEGAQAGLSWSTILQRRDGYRRAFKGFEVSTVAGFGAREVIRLLKDAAIIRNRRKIEGAIRTARVVRAIVEEQVSFDRYVFAFVGGRPKRNRWRRQDEISASTPESSSLSRDLARRGASFVGPTICYAFMQSCGLVNDHLVTCFRYREINRESAT